MAEWVCILMSPGMNHTFWDDWDYPSGLYDLICLFHIEYIRQAKENQ